MAYFDTSTPVFSELIRKLEVTDRAHADIFNEIFQKLLNNDLALSKKMSEEMTEEQVIEIYCNAIGIDYQPEDALGEAISDDELIELLNNIFG